MLQEEIETLSDLHQDIIQAIMADLETGSHHANNAAYAHFKQKYPNLAEAHAALGAWIEKQEEQWK